MLVEWGVYHSAEVQLIYSTAPADWAIPFGDLWAELLTITWLLVMWHFQKQVLPSFCVAYWPSTRPNMPFQSDATEGSDTFRWQLWEEIASADLADNMGQGKIPWYRHRLMHWKRVTCELHDSYFCLMMIKHAIPKILRGQLNYYITRWRQEVRSWRSDELETRWGRGSQHTERLSPRPPGAALENEKDTTLMAIRVGVNMLQFCSVSNSLSHANSFK